MVICYFHCKDKLKPFPLPPTRKLSVHNCLPVSRYNDFAKNLKHAIHRRIRPRMAASSNVPPIQRALQNQPASPQCPNTVLWHASYSNAVKNTPPWPYHLQTQPPHIPLATPQLEQRIPPAPHKTALHQMLPHAANHYSNRYPPTPHQTTRYAYPNALHQMLAHAEKIENASEETPLPQEIINWRKWKRSRQMRSRGRN